MLDVQPLKIEVEDIYFIPRLFRQGDIIKLHARGEGGIPIEEYQGLVILFLFLHNNSIENFFMEVERVVVKL
jgi:hypothetical protein